MVEGAHGPLIRRCDLDQVASRVLVVEYHGYHAQKFDPPPLTLPSQYFSWDLVRAALARSALVVCTRGYQVWEVAVPELATYEQYVRLERPLRRFTLGPGVLGEAAFELVVDIIGGMS